MNWLREARVNAGAPLWFRVLMTLSALAGCKPSSEPPAAASQAPSAPEVAVSAPIGSESAAPSASPATPRLEAEVRLPRDLKKGEKAPLFVLLHGLGGSSRTLAEYSDWPRFLERQRIAWVAPEGPFDREGRRFWDAGPSCCNFSGERVDHVAQLGELITRAVADNPIDRARVFVGGFSNGGFMAHRLGCELRPLIRGIVSIAGTGPVEEAKCASGSPLKVLQIHGENDRVVGYGGGRLFGNASFPEHASAEKTVQDWARRLRCEEQGVPGANVEFEATLPDHETRVTRFPGCREGAVELWTVTGGAHTIGFRAPSQEAIWRFLTR